MPEFLRRTIALPERSATGEIALLDFGDADRPVDIVFAHANGFNALTYRHLLAPLAASLRIIAYDARGHGRTTLPADPDGRNNWNDYRDDLIALMDALGIDGPVVLAGHSMGGATGVLAAPKLGARAKALALFEPVLVPRRTPEMMSVPLPTVQGALRRRAQFASRQAAIDNWRGRGAFATWPDEVLEDYAADGLVDDGEGGVRLACSPQWEASNFASFENDALPLLYATARPTRVLKAESGSTCRTGPEDAAVKANDQLDIQVIAGTTHFLPMERPELVREELVRAAAL